MAHEFPARVLSIWVPRDPLGKESQRYLRSVLEGYVKTLGTKKACWLTGWRETEVMTLQWKQVEWATKSIRLEPGTTKNKEGRNVPFWNYPQLEALLERQRAYTSDVQRAKAQIIPWVFHRGGRPVISFRGAWKKACEGAGLEERWVHDFRRSTVRRLGKSGVPRSQAMKLAGHKTESVYRRYAIVADSDLAEATGRLAAYHEDEVWAKHGQSNPAKVYMQ